MAGHPRRNQEGDQQGLAADPEKGRTCASAALGAASATPNITLTDRIRRLFFNMCIFLDLEVLSDGDGFDRLA